MTFKDDEMQRKSREFKDFLFEITGNQSEEARTLRCTRQALHNWLNYSESQFPAFMIEFHSESFCILDYFASRLGYDLIPKPETMALNGKTDDEEFALYQAVSDFRRAQKADPSKRDALRKRYIQEMKEIVATLEAEEKKK